MVSLVLALILLGLQATEDELADWAGQGRWDDVIVEASDRLAANEADALARYWLGRAWLARGESLLAGQPSSFAQDLANSSLERAIAQLSLLQPDQVEDAPEWLLYAEFLRGNVDLAQHLEDLFLDQGMAYAAFLRGRLAQGAGENAAQWFRAALDLSPEREDFALALSDQLLVQGLLEESLRTWQLARDLGASQWDLLPRLLSSLPSTALAERRLEYIEEIRSRGAGGEDGFVAWHHGHALSQLGRVAEAERVMAKATVNRTFDVDRAHSALLMRLGREREAVQKIVPWVDRAAEGAVSLLLNTADTAASRHAWAAALSAYDRVLRDDPDWERALRNRALTLSRSGKYRASLSAWRGLAERWPARADVVNDAALFLEAGGEIEEALILWRSVREASGSEDARENLAAIRLGASPDMALSLLKGILATEPTRDRSLILVHRARRSGSH